MGQCSWIIRRFFILISLVACDVGYGSLPVIDFHAIASMIKQLKQMKKDYVTLTEIKKTSQKGFSNLSSMLSGQYSYGGMGNDIGSLGARYAAGSDWESWQHHDSPAAEGLKHWSDEYASSHPLWEKKKWIKKLPEEERAQIKREIAESRAASIEAAYTYDQSEKRRSYVSELSKKIDETETTKAAIDLNSRLSVESQYMQTESLKQIALLNKQLAESDYRRVSARSQEASFTSMPDEERNDESDQE